MRRAGSAVAALALGLGAALLVRGRFEATPIAPSAGQTTSALTSAPEARAPSPAAPPTRRVAEALPPDVTRALESGPKEPLTPPVIRVEVELEGRGAVTSAPLTPPVIHVDAEAAPRSLATADPRGR